MIAAAMALFASIMFQEDPRDRIELRDQTSLRGQYLGCGRDGSLLWGTGGRTRSIEPETVRSLFFSGGGSSPAGPGDERIHFVHGGFLTGTVERFKAGRFSIRTSIGMLEVDRKHVESISFSSVSRAVSEERLPKKGLDRLIFSPSTGGKAVVWSGKLLEIGEEEIRMSIWEAPRLTEDLEKTTPRAKPVEIRFAPALPLESPPPGLFSKIRFRNGDRVVGTLFLSGKDRLNLFSHILGRISIPVGQVESLGFIREARTTWMRVLVCDRSGIREMDRAGKVHWSYKNKVQFSQGAERLENGNVLITSGATGQVIEVGPGGGIVWRLSGLANPYDAHRLPNGNTLVAEYGGHRVSEFDPRKKRVWSFSRVQQPTSVQRLPNGNTLIGSITGIIEVDPDGKRTWKARLKRVKPWRARRLENGNTLICDRDLGQVVEIERSGREVWKMTGLGRPHSALRTENGRTLILEQSQNRIIEVDSSRRILHQIDGLDYPMAISIY